MKKAEDCSSAFDLIMGMGECLLPVLKSVNASSVKTFYQKNLFFGFALII